VESIKVNMIGAGVKEMRWTHPCVLTIDSAPSRRCWKFAAQ
jgi:hypothetical protein